MEELFRRLFGITGGIQEQPVAQAFPIGQGQVEIAPISAGDMPIAQPVVPQVVPQDTQQGFSASNFLPSMDAMRNALPSMENLRGIIPAFAGLEGRINEAITPQLPAYMQGLLGTEVEAALPEQARRAGLLNAAAALMQASGPQDRRISLGQALGAGLQGYQQGSQGAFDKTLEGLALRQKLTAGGEQPSSVKEYQFAVSQGYKGGFNQFLTEKARAGATNVNVSTGDKRLQEVLGGKAGERLDASLMEAQSAQTTLKNIQELRPIIDEGVFSGPLSAAPRAITQIAASLGITGKDTNELLQRTAQAMQGLAQFELNAAAAMRGQGAITENERMLIQRAAAGRLDQFTSVEVKALFDAMEKTANYKIKSHNKQLDVFRKNPNPDIQSILPLYEIGAISPTSQKSNVKKFNPATGRVE